jgi:hypothetical protein
LTESDFIFAAKADQERNQDASRSQGKTANEKRLESEAIERAVYDGMQDLRAKKSR